MNGNQGKPHREPWIFKRLNYLLLSILALGIGCIASAIFTYHHYFGGPVTQTHSTWGEFGDFVGGTLNPILSFLALIGILLTLSAQNRAHQDSMAALAEDRETLYKQAFERTFFDLLRLHHEITSAIDLRDLEHNVTTQGRDCFRVFYKRFRNCYADIIQKHTLGWDKTLIEGQMIVLSKAANHSALIQEAYDKFFKANQHEISHYFRTLYRIFKFVDDSKIKEKEQYAGIARAQLSSFELALLFYNGIHPVGEGFRAYMEKYSLFDNMRLDDLLDPRAHLPLYDVNAYGNQDLTSYGIRR